MRTSALVVGVLMSCAAWAQQPSSPAKVPVLSPYPNSSQGTLYYDPTIPGYTMLSGSGSQQAYVGLPSNAHTYGAANAPISMQDVGSLDSLVDSRADAMSWQYLCAGIAQRAWRLDGPTGPDGFDSIELNGLENSSAWLHETVFSVPSGVTSVNFNATLEAGPANTGHPGMGFTQFNCSSAVNAISPTTIPTAFQTFTTTNSSLAVNTNYYVYITDNTGGQWGSLATSDTYISNLQVQPVGGTGFWGGHFMRIPAAANTMHNNSLAGNNAYGGYAADGQFISSCGASMSGTTDATTFVVEAEYTASSGLANAAIPIFVDGRLFTTWQMNKTVAGGQFFQVTGLPSGMHSFEVINDACSAVASTLLRQGAYPRALYFPATSTTFIDRPVSPLHLEIYGDSITQGWNSAVPSGAGHSRLTSRSLGAWMTIEGASSGSLSNDIGGPTETLAQALVSRLAAAQPTHLWLMIGHNDWSSAAETLAQWTTMYGDFLDFIHVRLPSTQVYAGMIRTGTEAGTNSNGNTPVQYRSAIQTNCAARPWCVYYDGTVLVSAATLDADGTHIAQGGQSNFSLNILNVLTSTTQGTFAIPSVAIGLDEFFGTSGLAFANPTKLGHFVPQRAICIRQASGLTVGAVCSGTGSNVVQLSDGTNTCTWTVPCGTAPPGGCATSNGVVNLATANGSGTGCCFAAGAVIQPTVTGVCGTTQPTYEDLHVYGVNQ